MFSLMHTEAQSLPDNIAIWFLYSGEAYCLTGNMTHCLIKEAKNSRVLVDLDSPEASKPSVVLKGFPRYPQGAPLVVHLQRRMELPA